MSLKENNYTIWCDFIERDFLEGEFQELIKNGVIAGATSNPAIFEQSITKSAAYKNQIKSLEGKKTRKDTRNVQTGFLGSTTYSIANLIAYKN